MGKYLVLIICLCLSVSGCAAKHGIQMLIAPENSGKRVSKSFYYKNYEIEILSEPPGASIEWNNEYLGETPLTYTYDGMRRLKRSEVIVKAYPKDKSQKEQVKVLESNVKLPSKICFFMEED